MNESNHIIDKVFLNINTGTLDEGEYIKNRISLFLENRLFPYLEKQFSIYDQPDRLLRFEKLSFELQVSSWSEVENLSFKLKSQLLDQLEEIRNLSVFTDSGFVKDWDSIAADTREKLVEHSHEVLSFETNRENVFLFYLERGYLPWYGTENHINEISERNTWKSAVKNTRFGRRLTSVLHYNEEALERLHLQFPLSMTFDYYFQMANVPERLHEKFEKLFRTLTPAIAKCLLKILILVTSKGNSERIKYAAGCIPDKIELSGMSKARLSEISNLWKTIYSNFLSYQMSDLSFDGKPLSDIFELKPFSPGIDKNVSSEKALQVRMIDQPYFEPPDVEVITSCAGIILLHPFLYTFFERTKITLEKGILPAESASIAVQALHYLATGSENFFGGNMVLEKFICGLPLKFPLERESQLTDVLKEEAENLLAEVIRQWPVLKKTSPDGLRQLFIQRQGKLVKSRDGFKLMVERKSQDVLLEKLHWNYSIVKFPWRDKLLFVEW